MTGWIDVCDSVLLSAAVWAVAAYLIVPTLSKLYFRYHLSGADAARVTQTSGGHPGDPINIALVGSDAEVVRGTTAAGWFPADPITFRSSMRIAADTVLHRPDDDAPVSNLFLFSRKQDLAFEQPVIGGPRHRHHVRFWRWDKLYEGRSVWVGAATFDERVGFSHTTGQVTHHISPDGVNRMVQWLSLQPRGAQRWRRSLAHRWSTGDCRNVRFRRGVEVAAQRFLMARTHRLPIELSDQSKDTNSYCNSDRP